MAEVRARAWSLGQGMADQADARRGALAPQRPVEAGRCPECREEKSWLRPGEVCAPCRAPRGAPALRLEEDEEPAAIALPVVPAPVAARGEVEMAATKWTNGLSAKRLREWREGRELSRAQLAEKLGVTGASIANWEADKAPFAATQDKLLALMVKSPVDGEPETEEEVEAPDDVDVEGGGTDSEEIEAEEGAVRPELDLDLLGQLCEAAGLDPVELLLTALLEARRAGRAS